MSSGHHGYSKINGMERLHRVLKTRRHAARALPHPGEEYTHADLPDCVASQSTFKKFKHLGVIHSCGHDGERHRWRTDPQIYEWIQTNLRGEPPGPCNHRGVRNLRDGAYSCLHDDCDAEFGRAIAERRFEGEYVEVSSDAR